MDRRRDRGRANGQRADDLDPRDLKYNVDFESHTITRNKDWSGRVPSSAPPPYAMNAHEGEDLGSGRRPARSGPYRGSRNGPGMTRHRMAETDEGDMDDFVEYFEDMGMDPRGHATPSGAQGRRGVGRRHVDDMDGFKEEMDPRRSSTRIGPQGRQGMRDSDMDGFEEKDIDPRRPSTRSGPQGRRGTEASHLNDMDGFEEDGLDPRRPSTQSGPQGRRGPGPGNMHRPIANVDPHAPGSGRASGPQPANPKSRLRELEAQLDKIEADKERTERTSSNRYGSSTNARDMLSVQQLVFKIYELKMEIYKIDPQSKRIDNAARFFLHLPVKGNANQQPGGSGPSHRGPAPRGPAPRSGGNHGGQRARPHTERDIRY